MHFIDRFQYALCSHREFIFARTYFAMSSIAGAQFHTFSPLATGQILKIFPSLTLHEPEQVVFSTIKLYIDNICYIIYFLVNTMVLQTNTMTLGKLVIKYP